MGIDENRFALTCTACGRTYGPRERVWLCACGGLLDLNPPAPQAVRETFAGPPATGARQDARGLWRYARLLPIAHPDDARAYGEGFTPLTRVRAAGDAARAAAGATAPGPLLKLDYLFPSGSFKDRGSAVMLNRLRELGVTNLVEDSSGNAGASIATYSARNGLRCAIFAPASASRGKLAQVAQAGARLVTVPGPREKATEAAEEAVRAGAYYAGHNRNPFFLAGLKTWAYEVYEQLGGRAPGDCVFPVGGGSALIGAHRGFTELLAAGLISRLPRLWAAQTDSCNPVARAIADGLDHLPPVEKRLTVAEGIALVRPPRGAKILEAIRESGGGAVTVPEGDVLPAAGELARLGFFAEPTSAVAWAGYTQMGAAGRFPDPDGVVVTLTGSGLKFQDWPVVVATP
ncbi:MAG: threonine synthase [Bacillota bacterium]